ncbi:unnamed protein product [Cuscuta epithymum]|uniref:DUF7806 domain-containing protein n=1 Tax=Cuscuta epithymum TaxID=186058 RepID=A0AAV0G5A1_9ASTE|nr:unnamed protein product [Cuscuta epithymum]
MEKMIREQEEKFKKHVAAARDKEKNLKSQIEKLSRQVHELRSELSSVRSTNNEQLIHYQNQLMEANLKNKDLSEEIARLRTVERLRQDNNPSRDDENGQANNHVDVSSRAMKRKRQSPSLSIEYPVNDDTSIVARKGTLDVHMKESAKELLCKKMIEAPCCRRTKNDSVALANEAADAERVTCMFQELVECIVQMKLSPHKENEENFISFLHEHSGYSFTLRLIEDPDGEAEWLYQLLSLGTLDRVAKTWMREDVIKFSTSMCPVIFQGLSRVIELSI